MSTYGIYCFSMVAMGTDDAARKRWKGVSKAERSQILRDAVKARWEQWRRDNPEKAAASEVRRAKRAQAKKAGKK